MSPLGYIAPELFRSPVERSVR